MLWLPAMAMTSPPLEALDIAFTVNPASSMPLEAVAGFEQAATLWESRLSDPVTVSLTIGAYDFGSERAGVIGGASPTYYDFAYSDYLSAYGADCDSEADAAVLSTLSTDTTYQRYVNNVSPGWNFFLDSSRFITSHSMVRLAAANARALGLSLGSATADDATIEFNSTIAFDYDRSDGITPGTMDFIGVAAHEIGHALGFTSIVDDVDRGQQFMTVLPSMPMDFIRFSAQSEQWAVQDVSIEKAIATQRRYLKIGDTNIPMSTGLLNGDGYQASHFLNGGAAGASFGIMDPTIALGETLSISGYDLIVFDAIGWDIVAVPEATTGMMALSGLAYGELSLWRRRCRQPRCSGRRA